jgi:hypothetical protein
VSRSCRQARGAPHQSFEPLHRAVESGIFPRFLDAPTGVRYGLMVPAEAPAGFSQASPQANGGQVHCDLARVRRESVALLKLIQAKSIRVRRYGLRQADLALMVFFCRKFRHNTHFVLFYCL